MFHLKKGLLCAAVAAPCLVAATSQPAPADVVIAFTSFEEPDFVSGSYTDSDTTDHEMINHPGEPIVQYTAGTNAPGEELGFRSFFSAVRPGGGLADGDLIGIKTSSSNLTSPYPDGNQGYRIQDPDGTVTVVLDTVDLTAYSTDPTLKLSAQYFLSDTAYETTDFVRIWVVVDGGVELTLLDSAGNDIDSLGIEGTWNSVSVGLAGYTQATFKFLFSSDATDEELWVDDVRITAVPEPATFVLAGLGGMLVAGRRLRVCV